MFYLKMFALLVGISIWVACSKKGLTPELNPENVKKLRIADLLNQLNFMKKQLIALLALITLVLFSQCSKKETIKLQSVLEELTMEVGGEKLETDNKNDHALVRFWSNTEISIPNLNGLLLRASLSNKNNKGKIYAFYISLGSPNDDNSKFFEITAKAVEIKSVYPSLNAFPTNYQPNIKTGWAFVTTEDGFYLAGHNIGENKGGQLEITRLDEEYIEGTFYLTANWYESKDNVMPSVSTLNVTKGYFKIKHNKVIGGDL